MNFHFQNNKMYIQAYLNIHKYRKKKKILKIAL